MNDSRSAPRTSAMNFTLIPAIVAGFVGLIYTAGALSRATQLHGAELPVKDFIPLFPAQALLASGVGVVVRSAFFVIFAASFVALVMYALATPAEERRARLHLPRSRIQKVDEERRIEKHNRRSRLLSRAINIVFPIAIFASAAGSSTFLTSLAYTISIVGGQIYWESYHAKRHRQALVRFTITYLLYILTSLANSYFHPSPLPSVQLVLSDRTMVSGSLVLHADGTWFLTNQGRHVVAIADARVRDATISSVEAKKPRSFFRWIQETL